MISKLIVALSILFCSCKVTKPKDRKICSFQQYFGLYEKINDTTAFLKGQEMGRTYLKLNIDSCKLYQADTILLYGFIYYPDISFSKEHKKISKVEIREASFLKKNNLFVSKNSIESDSLGYFKIKLKNKNYNQKDFCLLLEKKDFERVAVLFQYSSK